MFPKNSAFSKTKEQQEYQEGVRQRALNSVRESNELTQALKEAKALVEILRDHASADGGETNQPKARVRAHSPNPRRPY